MRVQSVELKVEHKGNHCQRMPEIGVDSGKGPSHGLPRYTLHYMGIFCYIEWIVAGNKLAPDNPP